MRLIHSFILLALFFLMPLSIQSQSVVESIHRFDTLSVLTLPSDATLLLDNINNISIVFDDPDIPAIDLPVTTNIKVYFKETDDSFEYFIYEQYDDGTSLVSDYIIVQRNLAFPMQLTEELTLPFYVGWSPLCSNQLNAVAVLDDAIIIRRFSGAIFLQSKASNTNKLDGGRKI
jgi:hypothetical protein